MTKQQDPPDDCSRPMSPAVPRRPYARPRLLEYGSVSKLTQGTNTKQSDAPSAGWKKNCL
jgi:hypothetical protein